MLADLLSPPIFGRKIAETSGTYFGYLVHWLSEPSQKTFTQAVFLILDLLEWLKKEIEYIFRQTRSWFLCHTPP